MRGAVEVPRGGVGLLAGVEMWRLPACDGGVRVGRAQRIPVCVAGEAVGVLCDSEI